MKKPNVIALPTSQMQALCDVMELPEGVQKSTESMILALEAADFSKVKVVKPEPGVPRERFAIGYELDEVSPEIVARRKAKMGRT
jgi:hypothetical protein